MARFLLRRGTDAEWAAADPVLEAGEPGFSTDSNAFKIGDGSTAWSSLSEIGGAGPGGEAFPVGSVFIAVVSTNPATLLGYGTWSAFGAGRVLVGLDSGDTDFDTVEETGGAKTHTLLTTEIPAHNHLERGTTTATGNFGGLVRDTSSGGTGGSPANVADCSAGFETANTGGGGAHNNLQPYIVVYMWKRTA